MHARNKSRQGAEAVLSTTSKPSSTAEEGGRRVGVFQGQQEASWHRQWLGHHTLPYATSCSWGMVGRTSIAV